MLSSLLQSIPFNLLEEGYEIGLNFLGKFAQAIIEGIGVIGVGIIVFALVLKAITLPFDIYQRIKMRKQNLIMKEMQPELEKLQQQYANDKTTYNQKISELYKKSGYSMLAACLPMIISLVILIVAFEGFRAFSQYANLKMYENMSSVYNAAIMENGVNGGYSKKNDDGTEVWVDYGLGDDFDGVQLSFTENWTGKKNGVVYTMIYRETDENGQKVQKEYMQVVSEAETQYVYYIYSLNTMKREYLIDTERLIAVDGVREKIDAIIKEFDEKMEAEGSSERKTFESACIDYVVKIGSTAAHEWYVDKDEQHDAHFLWVKNVWYPDVAYSHPIQKDYSSFTGQLNKKVTPYGSTEQVDLSSLLSEQQYMNLISEFKEEISQPNGYFILIILSIGLMVLSQFISMRSQKETTQYQSVDGKGASTQKMMMIMMPLIYAVFAFMYSAAFSIYMTMSSLISLLVTLLSNLIIGRVFKKKEEAALKERYSRTLPWQKSGDAKKDKESRKDQPKSVKVIYTEGSEKKGKKDKKNGSDPSSSAEKDGKKKK